MASRVVARAAGPRRVAHVTPSAGKMVQCSTVAPVMSTDTLAPASLQIDETVADRLFREARTTAQFTDAMSITHHYDTRTALHQLFQLR